MSARSWLVALMAFAPGCFHPTFDHTACGAAGVCPAGQACNGTTGFCEASETRDGGVELGDAMPGDTNPGNLDGPGRLLPTPKRIQLTKEFRRLGIARRPEKL